MSNEIVNYNPEQVTLLQMRADPKRFPRLKSLSSADAIYGLTRIVSQAFLYKGQNQEATNIRFIATALFNELMEDKVYGAQFISLAEIQHVIKRAVLASDMVGISVSSLYKVIMDYVKGEGHRLQVLVEESRRKANPASPMIQAYAGKFINKQNQ